METKYQVYRDLGHGPDQDGRWGSKHARFDTREEADEAAAARARLYPGSKWVVEVVEVMEMLKEDVSSVPGNERMRRTFTIKTASRIESYFRDVETGRRMFAIVHDLKRAWEVAEYRPTGRFVGPDRVTYREADGVTDTMSPSEVWKVILAWNLQKQNIQFDPCGIVRGTFISYHQSEADAMRAIENALATDTWITVIEPITSADDFMRRCKASGRGKELFGE